MVHSKALLSRLVARTAATVSARCEDGLPPRGLARPRAQSEPPASLPCPPTGSQSRGMNGSSVIAVSTSLGLSLILTPLVRHVCHRLRLYDLPGPLKIHSQPVPRLGGIAIALAFVAGGALERIRINSSTWLIFLALFLIWCTGVVDALRGLSPLLRLVGQIFAAALLWYGGWRVS